MFISCKCLIISTTRVVLGSLLRHTGLLRRRAFRHLLWSTRSIIPNDTGVSVFRSVFAIGECDPHGTADYESHKLQLISLTPLLGTWDGFPSVFEHPADMFLARQTVQMGRFDTAVHFGSNETLLK